MMDSLSRRVNVRPVSWMIEMLRGAAEVIFAVLQGGGRESCSFFRAAVVRVCCCRTRRLMGGPGGSNKAAVERDARLKSGGRYSVRLLEGGR
jgi:hypothetical protein